MRNQIETGRRLVIILIISLSFLIQTQTAFAQTIDPVANARQHLHQYIYVGKCEEFAENMSDTDKQYDTALEAYYKLPRHYGDAPYGALVFFADNHVGLSLGKNKKGEVEFISATTNPNWGVHISTVADWNAYSGQYLGWTPNPWI